MVGTVDDEVGDTVVGPVVGPVEGALGPEVGEAPSVMGRLAERLNSSTWKAATGGTGARSVAVSATTQAARRPRRLLRAG